MKKIREFAKLCGTSTKTLRFYDQKGILKADYTDPDNGYRYYADEQEERFARIRRFQEIGFTLDEIGRGLIDADAAQLLNALREKERALQRACTLCAKEIRRCENSLAEIIDIQRLDDENKIVVTAGDAVRVFQVEEEATEVCCHVLRQLFSKTGFIRLDFSDLPEFREEHTVLVQTYDGDAGELLATEPAAFFAEADRMADIRTVLFCMKISPEMDTEWIERIAGWTASCFGENACILWGADFDSLHKGNSVELSVMGIY